MWFKKKISIRNEETADLEGVQTWMVRWAVRDRNNCVYPRDHAQAFITQEDACSFALALEDAAKILGISGGAESYVEKV